MRLLVSMGVKPRGLPAEPLVPRLVELDTATGRVLRERGWTSVHGAGPGVHQEFTAGCSAGDGTFWLPTHTEILRIDLRDFAVVQQVHHPLFHGLHAVTLAPDGRLVAAAAGIDAVLEVDPMRLEVTRHFLRDQPFADAFPGIVDFRVVPYDALKPHQHHPNHAVWAAGALFATCFETRRAVDLTGGPPILLPEGIPHDGRLREGHLWFTQVDGRVIAVDPTTRRRVGAWTIDDGEPGLAGWCRGIEVAHGRLFVGFSSLRATRRREVARWLLRGAAGRKRPTRVVEVDRDTGAVRRSFPLGNHAGGTIYGIAVHPDDG